MNSIDIARIGKVTVSTIWSEQGFCTLSPPTGLFWETCIFGGRLDMTIERYSSEEGAIAGHHKLAMKVFNTTLQNFI